MNQLFCQIYLTRCICSQQVISTAYCRTDSKKEQGVSWENGMACTLASDKKGLEKIR